MKAKKITDKQLLEIIDENAGCHSIFLLHQNGDIDYTEMLTCMVLFLNESNKSIMSKSINAIKTRTYPQNVDTKDETINKLTDDNEFFRMKYLEAQQLISVAILVMNAEQVSRWEGIKEWFDDLQKNSESSWN